MKQLPKMVAVLITLLVVFSCATAPEPPPEEPAPEVAVTPEVVDEPRPESERASAQELRAIVIDYDLSQYAPDDFQEGEALFAVAEGAYETDNATARENYEAATVRYMRVIDAGFEAVSAGKRGEVEDAKAQADGIRARVTQTAIYDEAQAEFERADDMLAGFLDAMQYLDVLDAYDAARDGFLTAYRRAAEARERAQRALQDADGSISDSEREIEGLQQDLEAEDA